MMQFFRDLLGDKASGGSGRRSATDERQLAAAALLVEVAKVDARFDDAERDRILAFARERFSLSAEEAQVLLDAAQQEVDGTAQLYAFTTAIKNGFSYEERVELMETLWEVVYADGTADPFEDQVMRRIGALIAVTDRDRNHARKLARERRAAGTAGASGRRRS